MCLLQRPVRSYGPGMLDALGQRNHRAQPRLIEAILEALEEDHSGVKRST